MEYVNDGYVLTNKISEQNLREMRSNMDETDQEEFDKFVEENWGTYADNLQTVTTSATPTPKKRGRKPKAE